jgi:hypothetical protein
MSVKSIAIVVGLVVAQVALAALLLGIFHSPKPHELPVAVVGKGPLAEGLVKQLDATPELDVRRVDTGKAARALIDEREIYGAYAPRAKTSTVLVASAASPVVAGVLPQVFGPIDQQRKTQPKVVDAKPLPADDSGGASGYFLALIAIIGAVLIGWMLELLVPSIRRGLLPTLVRVVTLAVFSILSGLALALYAKSLGAFEDEVFEVTVALALTIFGVSTVQSGYTSVLGGTFGLAFGLLVFILLGVLTTSGGSTAPEFLPDVWKTIGGLLPPRAAMEVIKDQAYFAGEGIGTPMLVLWIYVAMGAVSMLAFSFIPRSK